MTIAVTGAGGFIGTHLLRTLVARGKRVIGIVRTLPADPVPGVHYVLADLGVIGLHDYRRFGSPDTLVHLAWHGLPDYRARRHFEEELPRQYAFLSTMVEAGLSSLVVTGTCFEYGMVDGELVETLPPRPDNPYAFAKVALHAQLRFLQRDRPFNLTWARLFYLWGVGQNPRSLWPLLQRAIAAGDPTFPMSSGEQIRDYLPVTEVADILALLALRAVDDGIVNICSGRPIAVRAQVEQWIAAAGASIRPEPGCYPLPDYEPLAFWGDPRRLRSLAAD